jgi:rhodanese-related sulfurtransferase
MPQIIVSRDELQERVNDGAHLPRAINIPLAKLSEKTIASLDKKNATIVHCYDYQ